MIQMFRNTAIAAGLLIVNIGAASAVPITWTLQDFAFVDGGTASGMFDFDADTGQVSNIDIISRFSDFSRVNDTVFASFTEQGVSEVPLPAAAWMFLVGLGGLSAARRKKRVAAK